MVVKKRGSTAELVFGLAKPLADELGLDLWDVCFEKEGTSWYLRVFIDKEDGIDIKDCEALSRPLGLLLDEKDPIDQSYIFEVGSAGLGRELKCEEHFLKFVGSKVRARFIRSIDGEKEAEGVLESFSKEAVTLLGEGGEKREIKLSDCSHINLCDDDELFE